MMQKPAMIDFDLRQYLLPGLPAYQGGRMSDAVYNAGGGRCTLFGDGETVCYDNPKRTEWINAQILRMQKGGFTFSAPCEGESFGPVTISNEWTVFSLKREGPAFTFRQDRAVYEDRIDPPVLVRAVTETTEAAFCDYIEQLKSLGLTVKAQRQLDGNRFYTLGLGEKQLFASFFGRVLTARFALDAVSCPVETFDSPEPAQAEPLTLCQFGLYYSYMRFGISADCGMLYIIKLPDRSLFLIDGGEMEQATDAACEEVMRVMRLMSQAEADEKIRIAGWFCTHAHDDHFDMITKLMRLHHDRLVFERVIFNFPAREHYVLMTQTHILLERIHRYYPQVQYMKVHTGQRFRLAGVDFDVLQTHEDGVGATGYEQFPYPEKWDDFNNTSTVLKVTWKDISFLVLGDINSGAEQTLLRQNGYETLHATAIQAAHHLINYLPALYEVICPDIALIPQSIRMAIDTNERYCALCKAVPPQRQYFASCATDLFEVRDGQFRLCDRFPIAGGVYDGSEV